jgi:hypothetical protein
VATLLADLAGRCQHGYLLAIWHQFRIKFAVCRHPRQDHKGAASCSIGMVNDGYQSWLVTEHCNFKTDTLKARYSKVVSSVLIKLSCK